MLDLLAAQPDHQRDVKARVEPGAGGRRVHRDRGVRRSGARPARLRDALQHAAGSRRPPHRRLSVRLRRDRAPARSGAAAQGGSGAAPDAEDGIARPADRRRRARLQQPARGVRQRRAAARAHRRPAAEPARVRGDAPRRRPRHRADAAPAGLLAPPAGESRVDRRRRRT